MTHLPFNIYRLHVSGLMLALLLACGAAHAADTQKGRQLYLTYCANCHGETGRSKMAGTPNFDRGEGMLRSDASLLASIRAGRNANPAFQGILKDREILDVIAYLRTLH
jgi:cytochrome c6